MRERCGRSTKRGTPCRLWLINGRCPTHNVDLSARNAKVHKSFRKRDRVAYREHQIRAGKAGFKATGMAHDWAFVNEKSRQWRLKHPSQPEQWALDSLAEAGINHFEREYPVLERYTVDLAWPESKRAVEIDGHPSRACADEQARRAQRQVYKLAGLAADGWKVLTIDADGDRQAAAQQLLEFARQAQAVPATESEWRF